MSQHHNMAQNHNMKTANEFAENVASSIGSDKQNQNSVYRKIKKK
jgi:hypothetical protein